MPRNKDENPKECRPHTEKRQGEITKLSTERSLQDTLRQEVLSKWWPTLDAKKPWHSFTRGSVQKGKPNLFPHNRNPNRNLKFQNSQYNKKITSQKACINIGKIGRLKG